MIPTGAFNKKPLNRGKRSVPGWDEINDTMPAMIDGKDNSAIPLQLVEVMHERWGLGLCHRSAPGTDATRIG
jgi:hypothetical protein